MGQTRARVRLGFTVEIERRRAFYKCHERYVKSIALLELRVGRGMHERQGSAVLVSACDRVNERADDERYCKCGGGCARPIPLHESGTRVDHQNFAGGQIRCKGGRSGSPLHNANMGVTVVLATTVAVLAAAAWQLFGPVGEFTAAGTPPSSFQRKVTWSTS